MFQMNEIAIFELVETQFNFDTVFFWPFYRA